MTVRSLSVNQYVAAPPKTRIARSAQEITVANLRSPHGTTRNLDHASPPQNRLVLLPATTGPAPQSHCAHIPASPIPPPIHPPPATAIVGLHLRHRRAARTRKPQRLQLVEGPIGADLGVRPLDPLLDLRQPRIDDPPPARRAHTPQPALIAHSDIAGHAVMRNASHLTGIPQRPTQDERFQHMSLRGNVGRGVVEGPR